MSSYYTELDDALGADYEAEIYMKRAKRRQRTEQKAFSDAVACEVQRQLKELGLNTAVKPTSKGVRGKTVEVKCKCGDTFTARVADRKRGWGRYCSKSCKAKFSR